MKVTDGVIGLGRNKPGKALEGKAGGPGVVCSGGDQEGLSEEVTIKLNLENEKQPVSQRPGGICKD